MQEETAAAAWFAARAAAMDGMSLAVVSGSAAAGATRRAVIDMPHERSANALASRLTLSRTAPGPHSRSVHATPDVSPGEEASRLVGLALRTAEARQPDLIIGWQLEPWGVAAAHAARLANLPYSLICHDGDPAVWTRDEDLHETYRAVVAGATHVMAPDPGGRTPLASLGLKSERWLPDMPRAVSPPGALEVVESDAAPGEAGGFRAPLLSRLLGDFDYASAYARESVPLRAAILELQPRPALLDEDSPVVAILDDARPGSGHDALIEALRRLIDTGTWDFRLLILLSGEPRSLEDALARIRAGDGPVGEALARRTILMPTVHPSLMPELLAQCDVVCCLDRPTGENTRRSRRVREALAAGAATLCSAEAVAGSGIQRHLVAGRNCAIVPHPSDAAALGDALRRLIKNEQHRRGLQIGARHLSSMIEGSLARWNPLRRLAEAASARAGVSARALAQAASTPRISGMPDFNESISSRSRGLS